jgi:hypothetical protein
MTLIEAQEKAHQAASAAYQRTLKECLDEGMAVEAAKELAAEEASFVCETVLDEAYWVN